MAKSRFEYVRSFESFDACLLNSWIVVRLDGRNFHRFSDHHQFAKPNDDQALALMARCAKNVMKDFNDIILSYGQSDEFSFVFRRETEVFQRRSSKLLSTVVSLFTSSYVFFWSNHFSNTPLQYPPTFDGRIVLYPTDKNLRDYLSWRQADCHINNLHNTAYWKLVSEAGMSPNDAQTKLGKMLANDKNEMLFSQFNTNYNNIPELFRKGTVLVREPQQSQLKKHDELKKDDSKMNGDDQDTKVITNSDSLAIKDKQIFYKNKSTIINMLNTDIIGNKFWSERPYLLTSE
ncbi:hypothetical protein HELRODRAFT_155808 [Helobdella robusta]|uniref:tRNA(His) guanylyltransferase n=1 Tax=Helobdella robusta TaxID=6412 RepID=T1ELM5_HELRO|nr:hypothetical protein HELRODRAFT_155808 [Helobdella robusta]ESO02299.1 hypothetical protein HELRODRAFT_155808 [Helobdella robusta]